MQSKYRFLNKDEFGKPCHRHQILVDGEYKDATGGSSIVDVLKKDGLTYWAAGLAVKTFSGIEDCKLLTKIKNKKASTSELLLIQETVKKWLSSNSKISEDSYIQLCIDAYFAHTVKLADSADAGTQLHKGLENYVKYCINHNKGEPLPLDDEEDIRVKEFSDFSLEHIKRFIWSEAHMFSEELFLGGISDVGAEMNDGSYAIIDFKSSKEAYFSHFIQASIYNLLIQANGLVNADGESLKVQIDKPISKYIIIPFGAKEFTVHENSNVEELKEAALACIKLYRVKAHFDGK